MPPTVEESERLLTKAAVLIRRGDVSGARLLLERCLAAGDMRAAFYLAETYDPAVLRAWQAYGVPGDLARARHLYGRALAAGVPMAKERLDAN